MRKSDNSDATGWNAEIQSAKESWQGVLFSAPHVLWPVKSRPILPDHVEYEEASIGIAYPGSGGERIVTGRHVLQFSGQP